MVKLAEYRDIDGQPRSKVTCLERGRIRIGSSNTFAELRLEHISEGWECAGSMARWTNEQWAVRFDAFNALQGRRFASKLEAENLFSKWNED